MAPVGPERAVGGDREHPADLAQLVGRVGVEPRRRLVDGAAEEALGGHVEAPGARVAQQRLGVAGTTRVDQLVRRTRGVGARVDRTAPHGHPGHADRVARARVVADVADPDLPGAGRGQGLDVGGLVGPRGDPDGAPLGTDGEDPAAVAGVVGGQEQPVGGHQPARLQDLGVGEGEHDLGVVAAGGVRGQPHGEGGGQGEGHQRPPQPVRHPHPAGPAAARRGAPRASA